ncbi:BMQ_0737 family morphogenetic spore coat protein [Gracilibacillus massiliensis]|uniref:hypothetical protein n=1 Tax=Gracilibacillus massiliensis TaxID=1564956 RepID=UPI000AA00F50|nr:hypothetical protein [Gracilibacillus massiliensis]
MNPELCELLENGGVVSCFLSDESGNRLDPFAPSSHLCEEINNKTRENVTTRLASGEEVELQRVVLRKSGFIVVEVSNNIDTCTSAPIPFCQIEEVLLCAPEGVDVRCTITDFTCNAFIHCQNGSYQSIDILLTICQDIKAIHPATIEINADFCQPRQPFVRPSCPTIVPPPLCEDEPSLEKKELVQFNESPALQQTEAICMRTEKVYDWISQQATIEIHKTADAVPIICDVCSIGLFVPAVIVCERTISGTVTCDGEPVANAPITFTASPDIVTIAPEPAFTNEFGHFEAVVTVPEGTEPTDITITAHTVVEGQSLSITLPTIVRCLAEPCILLLFGPESMECNDVVSGRVRCGNDFIPEVEVTLTANPAIVNFNPNPTFTGLNGNYFSGISVPPGTPPTDVEITASAEVDGQALADSITVNVACDSDCELTLTADPLITCEGEISGTLLCDGAPVDGAEVTFSNFPVIGTFAPNPVTTAADGTFSTTLTVPEGTPLLSTTITAFATVNGDIVSDTICIQVECPEEECPCKFRIGVQGGSAPATADITVNGAPSTLSGTINVTAVQCFVAAPMCNPAVDNFNVAFGSGGNTINFILGRRIEIECDGNTFARVRGTARASGNVFPNAIYEVTITLMIGPSNIGSWTVNATDFHGNTFATAFTAATSPITFIGDCEDTP